MSRSSAQTDSTSTTTADRRSAILAAQQGAAVMRAARGTQSYETLPHGCRCGARWAGSTTAHCAGTCHLTFSGVSTFDAHRANGQCRRPESVGMSLIPGRAYECWGYPVEAEGDHV